jgi:hypothetical protein
MSEVIDINGRLLQHWENHRETYARGVELADRNIDRLSHFVVGQLTLPIEDLQAFDRPPEAA